MIEATDPANGLPTTHAERAQHHIEKAEQYLARPAMDGMQGRQTDAMLALAHGQLADLYARLSARGGGV